MNDESELFEEVDCPHCGARDYRVLMPGTYPKGISRAELVEMYSASSAHALMDQLAQCRSCDLVHLNPRVRGDVIIEGYSSAVDPKFIAQDGQRVKTFRRALDHLTARHPLDTGASVLDVGCAGGAFPKAASDAGFDVVGVEPSEWLAEQGRERYGIDIRTGILAEQDFGGRKFDLVTLWDVIEHLTEPEDVLADIRSLLAPDGILVVNYPDYGALVARIMGRRWPFLLSVHLLYFTRKTIRAFLEKRGFEVLEIRPFFQTLELGYVLERGEPYAPPIVRPIKKLVELARIGRAPFTYNLAQSFLVARKAG